MRHNELSLMFRGPGGIRGRTMQVGLGGYTRAGAKMSDPVRRRLPVLHEPASIYK